MATVGTSTQSELLSYPNVSGITRNAFGVWEGALFVVIRTAADTLTIYRSLDNGGSWNAISAFSQTGLQEWSRLFVDAFGYGHIAYRMAISNTDSVWYRRVNLTSMGWSAGLQMSASDANGGTPGNRWQGIDLYAHRHPDGAYAIAVFAHYYDGSGRYGLYGHGVSITKTGTIYNNDGLMSNNRIWLVNGVNPGRSGVTVEAEHKGDGHYSNVPHLWVVYGRTVMRMIKLAWEGSGWRGPTNSQTIRTPIAAHDYIPAHWDGTQWVMGIVSPDDSTRVRIYQRNQANTTTVTYDTLVHPTGNIRQLALSYDFFTKDIRAFAVGTSTGVLYYCDYTRATGVWTAWASVVATAIGPGVGEFGVRAGGSSGSARIDVITTASGSPNTVSHLGMSTSSVPNNPTWAEPAPGSDLFNGSARDVASGLTLSWVFTDPDQGQTQGSYALSRQIGAGTVQYWRASDSTWQAVETQNSTATTSVTLPAAWGSGTDANHSYRVRVWDNANVASAGYGPVWLVVPSVKVDPTINTPTNAQVLNLNRFSLTWTVAEQTAYRVVLNTNPAGNKPLYDTYWVTDGTSTSHDVQFILSNGTSYTVTLQTRNNEGLASTAINRNFSVQFTGPPPVYSSQLLALPAEGRIRLTPANNAPVGLQPAVYSFELYRRPALTPDLTTNPSVLTTINGWSIGGGAGGTVTYSTLNSAPTSLLPLSSARLAPNGTAPSPSVESVNVPVDVGRSLEATGWARADTANKPVFIAINWYTFGGAYISSDTLTITTPPVAGWFFLRHVADGSTVPNASRASMSIGVGSTPAVGDGLYVDDARLRYHDPDPGVRVAMDLTPGAYAYDSGVASGVDYEYQWVTTGANGTVVYGPWQN